MAAKLALLCESKSMGDRMKKEKLTFVDIIKKMPSLFFGFLLFAVGILSTLYSDLGMSPWDVFHMGIVKHSNLTLGQVSQLTGVAIIVIAYFCGVIPGLGSVFNMFFIGFFIDLLQSLGIFYTPETLILKVALLIFGILMMGWASFFYLRVGLGAGPRDSMMETLVKKTGKPVWLIRNSIEMAVLVIGAMLGGPVGIGTIITVFGIGFSVQLAFMIGGYSSKEIEHINIIDVIGIRSWS